MKKNLKALLLSSILLMASSLPAEECWQGFYITGQAGWGWSSFDASFKNANYFNTLGPTIIGSDFDFHTNGFVGGGGIGYNFQCSNFVIGVEGNALYTNIKKSRPSPFFPTIDVFSYQLRWLADAKLRLGYACDCFLFFAEGGWAGGDVAVTLEDIPSNIIAKNNHWANGWTVGGGVEYLITSSFSLGVAYDYFSLSGKKTASCPQCGTGVGFGTPEIDNHIKTQAVTLRISYHL